LKILRKTKNVFIVKGSQGDIHLGGRDFDNNLINFLKSGCEDPKKYDSYYWKSLAITTKHELSIVEMLEVPIGDTMLEVSRVKFEEINNELIERSMKLVHETLALSQLNPNDIDEILLAGGSSRMPWVREHLEAIFGGTPILMTIDPDEVVAIGACYLAQSIEKNDDVESISYTDSTSHDLGIGLQEKVFGKLISKGSQIPTIGEKTYFTTPGQTGILVPVFQGNGIKTDDTDMHELGGFQIDLGRMHHNSLPFIVTLKIDDNGMVSCKAENQEHGYSGNKEFEMKNLKSEFNQHVTIQNISEYKVMFQNPLEELGIMVKILEKLKAGKEDIVVRAKKYIAEYELSQTFDATTVQDLINELKELHKWKVVKKE